jgi:hypothetical protein
LPGEAFCDECGAQLNLAPPPIPVAADAPTIFSAAPTSNNAPTAAGIVCKVCGHINLPGDDFCDACGAALTPMAVAVNPPPNDAAPTEVAPPVVEAPPVAEASAVPIINEEPTVPPVEATVPPVEPTVPPVEPTVPPESAPVAPAVPAIDEAQAAYEAQRQALEAEIAKHQQVIAQLEPVQNALGAATPAGVAQSLDDARAALATAETALAGLQPPAPAAPAVDPAEVARLEGVIAAQNQIIAQLEPVQNALGAATPAGVAQSLSDARTALGSAQAELDTLLGKAPTSAPTEAAPVPAIPLDDAPTIMTGPSTAPAEAVSLPGTAPFTGEPPLPPVNVPPVEVVPPATAVPRLIFDSGKEVALPLDRSEIIIGREDPISGIHPEIDMTPHGGETGGVSRQHARITRLAGNWVITDLNSTNQTRVNGVRADPNVPVNIEDGARLQFGKIVVLFRTV